MDRADRLGELSAADQEQFFALSRSLFAVVDRDGTVLRLSLSWEQLLGCRREDLVGRHFAQFAHPDDVVPTPAQLLAGADAAGRIENRCLRADGSSVWLRWDVHGAPDGSAIWCIARDVTHTHRRVAQQQVVAELGRLALDSTDPEELLAAAVQGVTRALDLPYASVAQLVPDSPLMRVRAAVGAVRADGSPLEVPSDLTSLSGRAVATGQAQVVGDAHHPGARYTAPLVAEFGIRSAICVAIGRQGATWGALTAADRVVRHPDEGEVRFLEQVAHVLATAVERREVEEQLHHQATHDSLTGLPNRQLLRERVDTALRRARRTGGAMGLLLCDLDGFKDINDSLGHAAGDSVLQQLAERLLSTVGAGSTVARLGGDEFALCIVGPATELEVLGVADAVVQVMRRPFALPGLDVPLSISIGVTVSPTHGRDASTLLRHADVAMYRAKARGLGWALYDAQVDAARGERLTLTADLRAALERGGLALHYQPVVDLATGRLHSVEALCRWTQPGRGVVPPSTFIPLAEQTGLIRPLTAWVVAEAATQAQAWWDAGHDVRCAVNLSMAAVADDRTSAGLLRQLVAAAPRLTVE
ncbi:MAG: hypothetical protein JWN87_1791, partial [Frankiales bacterium]|nr:hypothetical protein [Frankiales bacterium]